jgi:hypothetical protein
LPGELDAAWSKGGETGEFIENNFTDKYYEDIVYVSATPRHAEYLSDKVFEYIPVWESEWDDETGMVPAEKMHDYCVQALEDHPDKRIIFHFIQPHLSIYSSSELSVESDKNLGSDKTVLRKFIEGKISKTFPGESPWRLYQEGQVDKQDLWGLQRAKLEEFFEQVDRILPFLSGEIVITSDHGNCYGEKLHPLLPWRIYEHPKRMNHTSLRKIPWFRLENTEKTKEISASNSNKSDANSDIAKERLRDLGYI